MKPNTDERQSQTRANGPRNDSDPIHLINESDVNFCFPHLLSYECNGHVTSARCMSKIFSLGQDSPLNGGSVFKHCVNLRLEHDHKCNLSQNALN